MTASLADQALPYMGALHAELRTLIASSLQRLAGAVNAELTRLYWALGQRLELLQMHKDGITVAEYWTALPPKAELEQKLHAALLEARERLARRGEFWRTWMTSDDMKPSKYLGFPVVALPGMGPMPAKSEDEKEAARVFYVAATRPKQRWEVGAGGEFGGFLSIGLATAHGLFPTLG